MIRIEEFHAGSLEQGYQYKYFLPTRIHDAWKWESSDITILLEKAATRLGELNSFSKFVPNIDMFIQSHVINEAVQSSKIEGTQTNVEEAAMPLDEIQPERKDDWTEVNNYIKAINSAIGKLEQLPLSSRLIKQTHQILLDSVRGTHKSPGEFRTSQNWIGGASIADARFIPPAQEHVLDLMHDFECFINEDTSQLPTLIKAAIAHYQFETIHPFLDGNGRIGRLLITLFLVSEGVLEKPLLYLSHYFEINKGLYYENLTAVRERGELGQWLKYFLVGVEQTATDAIAKLKQILELQGQLMREINQNFGRKTPAAQQLLESLFKRPVIRVEHAEQICDLSYKSANNLIADMLKHNILEETTGNSRNRIFVFRRYLRIMSDAK
ncbi:MAG: Fic family protein [Akkermansia sp.]